MPNAVLNSILFYPWAFLIAFFLSIISTVGLNKILSLLESEDANIRIHAVKVVANLAAEGGLSFIRLEAFLPLYFIVTVWSIYSYFLN